MRSKPWLACACERSRRSRAPGEKASADLKKLQQILTMVQLASILRDSRSRMSKLKYSRAPRSGTCVPNLGPTYPTPVHSVLNAASTDEDQTCLGRLQSYEVSDGTASRAAGVRLKRKMKIPRASPSGMCVPNLGPTSLTPLHSRTQRSKHR